MYKLEFTLKQHTPLIHFQHDQSGATLRATEVKPKLDKFLITQIGKGDYETGKSISKGKGWLIGNGDHYALEYKLKITQKDAETMTQVKNPNYFGNIGLKKDEPRKEHRFGDNDLFGTFLFTGNYQPDTFFKENLMSFFLINNFGCRSGKGSGSFTLSSFDQTAISVKENVNFFTSSANDNYFRIRFEDYLSFKSINPSDIFQIIDYYSKRLKTGINYTRHDRASDRCAGEYKKSFLFNYIKTNTWEKRWLKENFINLSPNPDSKALEPRFTRAFLGLSDKYSFMDKTKLKDCKCNSEPTKVAHTFKFEIKVSSDEIERIPSPVIFKPVILGDKTFIFLLLEKRYSEWDILGKEFKFKMQDTQFPLYCGNTNKRGDHIPDFIKQNEKWKEKSLLEIHNKFLMNNPSRKDQSKELRDFFSYSIPQEEILETPQKGIILYQLLKEYHTTLGKSFNAFDFQNNVIAKVNIESI